MSHYVDPVIRNAYRVLRRAAAVLKEDDPEGVDDSPFHGGFESSDELRTPDLTKTKRLDREQELQGLDTDRRVEDVESYGMRRDR